MARSRKSPGIASIHTTIDDLERQLRLAKYQLNKAVKEAYEHRLRCIGLLVESCGGLDLPDAVLEIAIKTGLQAVEQAGPGERVNRDDAQSSQPHDLD